MPLRMGWKGPCVQTAHRQNSECSKRIQGLVVAAAPETAGVRGRLRSGNEAQGVGRSSAGWVLEVAWTMAMVDMIEGSAARSD